MGHEAEDEARWVTDACYGIVRAVEVVFVSQSDLIAGAETFEDLGGCGDEAAFAVCDGQEERVVVFIGGEGGFHAAGPDAGGLGDGIYLDPFIDEACAGVVGQGDLLGRGFMGRPLVIGAGEEAELDEDLEAVADADHGDGAVDGGAEGGVEALAGFHGEYAARSNVIAVAETTGETDEIELVDLRRFGYETVEVDQFGLGAGQGEGTDELLLTVGPGGSDHERFWHGRW